MNNNDITNINVLADAITAELTKKTTVKKSQLIKVFKGYFKGYNKKMDISEAEPK